jgi:hypothetical protein
MDSGGKFVSSTISNGYVSDESYITSASSVPKIRRKESVQRTLSAADSKTSTLVNSLPVSFMKRSVFRNSACVANPKSRIGMREGGREGGSIFDCSYVSHKTIIF